MSLSPMVAEWVAAYEQEHGYKPAELVRQMAGHIAKFGRKLRDSGNTDALEGCTARHREAFESMVCEAFHLDFGEDPDFVEAIADLWQAYYMDGYREGGGLGGE